MVCGIIHKPYYFVGSFPAFGFIFFSFFARLVYSRADAALEASWHFYFFTAFFI